MPPQTKVTCFKKIFCHNDDVAAQFSVDQGVSKNRPMGPNVSEPQPNKTFLQRRILDLLSAQNLLGIFFLRMDLDLLPKSKFVLGRASPPKTHEVLCALLRSCQHGEVTISTNKRGKDTSRDVREMRVARARNDALYNVLLIHCVVFSVEDPEGGREPPPPPSIRQVKHSLNCHTCGAQLTRLVVQKTHLCTESQ